MKYIIRWMVSHDLDTVVDSEDEHHERFQWDHTDFEVAMHVDSRNVAVVATYNSMVVGHMIYHLHDHSFEIYRLSVPWAYQRHRVATALVRFLKSKLAPPGKRTTIVMHVPESLTDLQLFLSKQGFVGSMAPGAMSYGERAVTMRFAPLGHQELTTNRDSVHE